VVNRTESSPSIRRPGPYPSPCRPRRQIRNRERSICNPGARGRHFASPRPVVNVIQLFLFGAQENKLERLSLASLSSLAKHFQV
jgi:hypothetical protein